MKDKLMMFTYFVLFVINIVYVIVFLIPILVTLLISALIAYMIGGDIKRSDVVNFYLEYVFMLPIVIFTECVVPLFSEKRK